MIISMKVPSPGESISDVQIAQWLVKTGDYVTTDQELVEVDSDKATLSIPAESSGVITILIAEGETVNVGDEICTIDTSAAAPEGIETKVADTAPEKAPAEKTAPAPAPEASSPA